MTEVAYELNKQNIFQKHVAFYSSNYLSKGLNVTLTAIMLASRRIRKYEKQGGIWEYLIQSTQTDYAKVILFLMMYMLYWLINFQ